MQLLIQIGKGPVKIVANGAGLIDFEHSRVLFGDLFANRFFQTGNGLVEVIDLVVWALFGDLFANRVFKPGYGFIQMRKPALDISNLRILLRNLLILLRNQCRGMGLGSPDRPIPRRDLFIGLGEHGPKHRLQVQKHLIQTQRRGTRR